MCEKSKDAIFLYRFESDYTRLTQLEAKQIYLSDPSKLNDPVEFHLTLKDYSYRAMDENKFKDLLKFIKENNVIDQYCITDKEIDKKIRDFYKSENSCLDSVIRGIEKKILSFRLLCLMQDFKSTLSWSHYAGGHRGYCIEYKFRPIDLVCNGGIRTSWDSYHVNYTNRLPEICISEVLLTPQQAMRKLLATKELAWSYEQEIRIINYEKNEGLVNIPDGLEINSLIAGSNISAPDLVSLKKTAKILNLPIYQMKRNFDDEFGEPWKREML